MSNQEQPVPHFANFLPYFGNKTPPLPEPGVWKGGAVSFKKHIGNILTSELWDDIVYRLQARKLHIFRYNQEQWTIGLFGKTCVITLDPIGLVKDIEWYPPTPTI